MNFTNSMIMEMNRLHKRQQHLGQDLANAPEGQLRIDRNGQHTKWRRVYDSADREPEYISKRERELAGLLAKKKCDTEELKEIDRKIGRLSQLMESYELDHDQNGFGTKRYEYLKLASYNELETRTDAVLWENEPYERSTDYPEQLIVPTKAGIMVRSKSEAMIANLLLERHIPYRYEQAISIGGVRLYPDFTIRCPGHGKEGLVYWEHCGLMDKPGYVQTIKMKFNTFLDAGFLPGRDIIMTFEDKAHPLDLAYLEMLVAYHF